MFTGFQGSDAVCNHGDGIVAAECKVVLYTAPSDEQLQAQNFTCDTSGLLCSDADNSYGCHDYAVRYHCITPGNTLTTLYAVTCKDSKHWEIVFKGTSKSVILYYRKLSFFTM